MKVYQLCLSVLAVALAGCTTSTSDLPKGARLVGGGLLVDYEAPVPGTAILIERTSRRIVATESLPEGSSFSVGPGNDSFDETLFRMFASTNSADGAFVLPTNTFFELYFVPEK